VRTLIDMLPEERRAMFRQVLSSGAAQTGLALNGWLARRRRSPTGIVKLVKFELGAPQETGISIGPGRQM
jgi:hypothetical protein